MTYGNGWTSRWPIASAATLALAAAALLGACAATETPRSREVLDENSGTTLIVAQRPTVFARPRTDVAANVRDYLTLVAAEEDRSGKYKAWLIIHRWSTVDPRMEGDTDGGKTELHVIADDRQLDLQRIEPPPAILVRGDILFAPRAARAQSWAYGIDDDTLRYIAESHRLLLRVGDDSALSAYAIWDDGREAMRQLLADVGKP